MGLTLNNYIYLNINKIYWINILLFALLKVKSKSDLLSEFQ